METLPVRIFGFLLLCLGMVSQTRSAEPLSFTLKEPLNRTYRISSTPAAQELSDDAWLAATEEGSQPREVRISARLVIQTAPGTPLDPLLEKHRLQVERAVRSNLFILRAGSPLEALRVAAVLAGNPTVTACYPIMRKRVEPDTGYAPKPNDQYFMFQGYHEFRDGTGASVGPDINTRAAWPYSTGEGVVIAVADSGVQGSHPELVHQLAPGKQHNFANDTDDGSPSFLTASWVHGMSVAGLAVAEGNNNVGMIGVAPGAKLASWVIFDETLMRVGEDKMMDLYTHENENVQVQNHSWGAGDVDTLNGPGLLELAGIQEAIENGRSGKGVVMVRSGGNRRLRGGNANYSFYPSDPRVIGVAAVNNAGRVASYSNPGASLLVAAPGGEANAPGPFMFTLDFLGADGSSFFKTWLPTDPENTMNLWDYRYDFQPFVGTSAAAPVISGVCALMLSANSKLTFRDVQQILALSARHRDVADPDLRVNGAGFPVSHNQGFGIVDAGTAVQLARGWIIRPPMNAVTNTIATDQPIPDDGYRLVVSGTTVPATLNYITNRTSLGPIVLDTTADLPIVDIGLANSAINVDLTGKIALIERGGADFSVKIGHAADAGAAFVVVYNNIDGSLGCPGGDALCPMGGTDFTGIPAVFIGNTQGTALKALVAQQADTRGRLQVDAARVEFQITDELLLEHVGIRLKTDHPLRGDLHVTVESPAGTASVLQRFNADTTAGPVDWTYYSTHHLGEGSRGTWRVTVMDQAEAFAGNVLETQLILNGVPITDTDGDGLDDDWERVAFLNLAMGPKDDPDHDGYSNAREQLMRTNPMIGEIPFRVEPAVWNADLVRLSWPGVAGANYQVLSGSDVLNLNATVDVAGTFPETIWFTARTNLQQRFFLIRRQP